MNHDEAKNALFLYRPGRAEEPDGEIAHALKQVERDPELRRWFEQTSRFHEALAGKLQQIPVPSDLKEAILAKRRIVRPLWWQQPVWLASAAVVVILLSLSAIWLQQPRIRDHFSDYRVRMVRVASRKYRMDLATNDLHAVQRYMARRGAPSDFVLAKGLEKLHVTGGVVSTWRGNPVSMVCFDRGDKQMVFLFVIARSAVKDAPPASTSVEMAKVNKLLTSGWSDGDKTYLLAGPEDSAVLRRQ